MRSMWTIAFLFCILPYAITSSSCKKHVIQTPAVIDSGSTNNITIEEIDDDKIYSVIISNVEMDCESGIHHLMLSLIPPFGEELLLQDFSRISNECNQTLSTSVHLCFNQQQGEELRCDYVNSTKNETNLLTLKPEDNISVCNGKSTKGKWILKFTNIGQTKATISHVGIDFNCVPSESESTGIKDQAKWVSLFTVGCFALFIPFFALSFKYYVADRYQLFGWFKKQRIWRTFSMKPTEKDWTMLE